MGTTSFTQLEVWKKAHRLALEVYRVTKTFPEDERYGLASQMRRAAVSVPANIAEGYGRRSAPDKARVYYIGQSSLEELRYYVILARELGSVAEEGELLDSSADEVGRMLRSFTDAVRRGS